jgi:hypothetical protein
MRGTLASAGGDSGARCESAPPGPEHGDGERRHSERADDLASQEVQASEGEREEQDAVRDEPHGVRECDRRKPVAPPQRREDGEVGQL